jgi:hypothetical protein
MPSAPADAPGLHRAAAATVAAQRRQGVRERARDRGDRRWRRRSCTHQRLLRSHEEAATLVELLAEAFDQAPWRPAERDLAPGIVASAYWSFAPSPDVVVAEATTPAADGHAQRAWRKRLDRRQFHSSC